MEEGEEEEEEEAEEEDEEEDGELEVVKPRKRIGRPPKMWSSILLPKEVTSTLGAQKPRPAKSQKPNFNTKSTNVTEGESLYCKVSPMSVVGQTVHGVVDGCFDAGFLVSLQLGDSDHIYRGVVFGPGLSIPVSKETDVAKNVKRKRRKRNQLGASATSKEEPSTPPHPLPAPPREEAPPPNLTLMQPPTHYEAHPLPQHTHHPNTVQHGIENPHINPIPPQPHPHQFPYNGAMHANSFRSPRPPHPEINVNPYMHSGGFPPRATMSMPPSAQGYSPRQTFGHVIPSPSMPYGYNFTGTQGRPSAPLPQYRGPPGDSQYRGP